MHSDSSSAPAPPGSAAERLVDAAERVFARQGIASATTREIAKEAGVNEVTLFRNFQTKQGLLAAVLERAFLPPGEGGQPGGALPKDAGLQEVLMDFARRDFERKRRNIELMRVLLGEIHRLGDQETEVLRRIFQPWKDELLGRLREAQRKGEMRAGIKPVLVVDQLVAMLFIGALRAETMKCVDYSPEDYLVACVATILHGVAAAPAEKKGKAGKKS